MSDKNSTVVDRRYDFVLLFDVAIARRAVPPRRSRGGGLKRFLHVGGVLERAAD